MLDIEHTTHKARDSEDNERQHVAICEQVGDQHAFALALAACLPIGATLSAHAADPVGRLSLLTDPTPGRATQHGLAKLAAALTDLRQEGYIDHTFLEMTRASRMITR